MFRYSNILRALFVFVTLSFYSNSYATSYGTNIVTNGDAETGDLTGWTASGVNATSLMVADAYFGENVQSLHGKVLELYNSTPNIQGTLSQIIDISDIQSEIVTGSVSASLSVQAFSWFGALASYSITELDASGNVINMTTSGTLTLPGQAVNYHITDSSACMWTTTSVTVSRLNVGTKKLRVSIYGRTSTNPEDFVDFDNVQLVLSALPTVSTTPVTIIGKNSASMGGNVTSEKGAYITQRGVVYSSTTDYPSIGGTDAVAVSNGFGTGVFSASISALSSGTKYYMRAYATNSVGTNYGSVVSFTTLAPSITTIVEPASDTYKIGENLDYNINFSENVTVTGSPYLNITVGVTGKTATYVSGSGTSTIKFRYTVVAGDEDLDGVALSSDIVLNGGTIKDAANNSVLLKFTGNIATSVKVDGVPPTVSGSVISPIANTYAIGTNLDYTLNFSENVTVTGSPNLNITVGATGKTAIYVSGSGTSTIKFRYTVVAGDEDLDGVALNSDIVLNGGTIMDAAGNDAVVAFAGSTSAGVLVDAVPPTILAITLPADGSYRVGDLMDFVLEFSEPVAVSGSPKLAISLTTGGPSQAVYVSGSETNKLLFRYTVKNGESAMNGIQLASEISLSGGDILDSVGQAGSLELPVHGSTAGIIVVEQVVRNVASTSKSGCRIQALPNGVHIQIAEAARMVEVMLLDASGRSVARQSIGNLAAGSHDVKFSNLTTSWQIAILRVDGKVYSSSRGN